jgi:hypothetical protein
MRKVLVVLLVLSVIGGVSAQEGSWSIGGTAEIGFIIDFDADPGIIGGHAYNRYDWYGDINATVGLAYNRGGLRLGLDFDTADMIRGSVSYTDERFAFVGEATIMELLLGIVAPPDRLWGWYKMLDGMVHMEAAFVSADTNFWNSSEIAGEIFDNTDCDLGWGFASVDGHNYFLVDFDFSGINFGIMLPYVFVIVDPTASWEPSPPTWQDTRPGHHGGTNNWGAVELVDGVFQNMVIGLKFNMDPVEFAAQFNMTNYGAYLGAKWGFGDLDLELSFEGVFDGDLETQAVVGLGINYNGGGFGARLGVGYWFHEDDDFSNVIGVMPSFWYNVLPDNMAISLDALFTFSDDEFHWRFVPQIFWNFKGTGAGADYWWPNQTGFIFRYVMERDTSNSLDVTFKWNF